MRRPSKGKKSDAEEDVPPGGRAFQRIQQDRLARGLGEVKRGAKLLLAATKAVVHPRKRGKSAVKPRKRDRE